MELGPFDIPLCILIHFDSIMFSGEKKVSLPKNKNNFYMCIILVKVTFAIMKHHGQKHFGEERVYLAIFLYCFPSLKEDRAGTQTEHEPGGRC